MLFVVIALYVAGVALPVAGLIRLAVGARRAVKAAKSPAENQSGPMIATGSPGNIQRFSVANVTSAAQSAASAPFESWRAVVRDLIFIGLGVVASGVASILSLFL
ncbi:MAG: hypothetical protein JWO18_2806 [Microbacteriaceae bacterium]|nr:hypothetical protein [Microbacteriaceae bacterium]